MFPYIFNFPTVFFAQHRRYRRRRQRQSPFTRRILCGIFLCRQIGLLSSQLSYLGNAFSREPHIFSPIHYLGAHSRHVLLLSPLFFPRSSFLSRFTRFLSTRSSPSVLVRLTRNSLTFQSAAQLLKQPIPTERAPRYVRCPLLSPGSLCLTQNISDSGRKICSRRSVKIAPSDKYRFSKLCTV